MRACRPCRFSTAQSVKRSRLSQLMIGPGAEGDPVFPVPGGHQRAFSSMINLAPANSEAANEQQRHPQYQYQPGPHQRRGSMAMRDSTLEAVSVRRDAVAAATLAARPWCRPGCPSRPWATCRAPLALVLFQGFDAGRDGSGHGYPRQVHWKEPSIPQSESTAAAAPPAPPLTADEPGGAPSGAAPAAVGGGDRQSQSKPGFFTKLFGGLFCLSEPRTSSPTGPSGAAGPPGAQQDAGRPSPRGGAAGVSSSDVHVVLQDGALAGRKTVDSPVAQRLPLIDRIFSHTQRSEAPPSPVAGRSHIILGSLNPSVASAHPNFLRNTNTSQIVRSSHASSVFYPAAHHSILFDDPSAWRTSSGQSAISGGAAFLLGGGMGGGMGSAGTAAAAGGAALHTGVTLQLQLMHLALAHTSCIIMVLTLDGRVLYQNGRCAPGFASVTLDTSKRRRSPDVSRRKAA